MEAGWLAEPIDALDQKPEETMVPDRLTKLEDYGPFVGDETIDRIRQKASTLRGMRVLT